MNYFGKHVLTGGGAGKIKLKPVLMQKGKTRLALYGLGYIRDARLHQMFSVKGNVEWARPEDTDEMALTSWFNLMLIHQNRVSHTPKNAISERYLPSWLDLVVWGHEHECLVEPTEFGEFFVSQPGSSVVTSLIEGEAKQKKIMLLEVKSDPENPRDPPFWRAHPIPLETTRPFSYRHVQLMDVARLPEDEGGLGENWTAQDPNVDFANGDVPAPGRGRRPAAAAHEQWVKDLLEKKVEEMIDEVLAPHRAARNDDDPPLPLIRLRVDYTGGFSTINAQRFGQKFVGKVANPNDIIQFHKSAVRRRREAGEAADAAAQRQAAEEETIGNPQMQDQRRIENLVSVNLTKGLQLLSENDLSNALDDFVNRDPSAISKLVERRMKETQALVDQEAAADVESDDEMTEHIRKAVAESAARSAPTERAQAATGANGNTGTQATTIAAAERNIVNRMMAGIANANRNGDAMDTDRPNAAPSQLMQRAGGSANPAPSRSAAATTAARGRRAASPAMTAPMQGGAPTQAIRAPEAPTQAIRGPTPSQTTAKSAAPRGRGSTAASKPTRAKTKKAVVNSDSGDDVISLDDSGEDSGDDEDVVPMSVPASKGRGGRAARPTRAVAAAKATAAKRGARGKKAPPQTEDAFDFDGSDDDDFIDDSEEEDSGDHAEEIRTTGRGAKRKAPSKAPAATKKAKAAPKKKSPAKPPPGRKRTTRAIEIDDSGDYDEEIPATAPSSRGGRCSTRAR